MTDPQYRRFQAFSVDFQLTACSNITRKFYIHPGLNQHTEKLVNIVILSALCVGTSRRQTVGVRVRVVDWERGVGGRFLSNLAALFTSSPIG